MGYDPGNALTAGIAPRRGAPSLARSGGRMAHRRLRRRNHRRCHTDGARWRQLGGFIAIFMSVQSHTANASGTASEIPISGESTFTKNIQVCDFTVDEYRPLAAFESSKILGSQRLQRFIFELVTLRPVSVFRDVRSPERQFWQPPGLSGQSVIAMRPNMRTSCAGVLPRFSIWIVALGAFPT
jgi:hypothetical protein